MTGLSPGGPTGFPRAEQVGQGIGPIGQPPAGMGEEQQAAPGFQEALKAAGAQPAQAPEQISPIELMQRAQMGPATLENVQQRMATVNSHLNTAISQLQAKNIQGVDQLPGGKGIQLIGGRRLDQMHDATQALSSIAGMQYNRPAKSSPLVEQLTRVQDQFQQVGNTMATMGKRDEGMNVTDLMRAQSQVMKLEQTVGFFSAASGEAISGLKTLFQQQI